jgi:hypothetical protein
VHDERGVVKKVLRMIAKDLELVERGIPLNSAIILRPENAQ